MSFFEIIKLIFPLLIISLMLYGLLLLSNQMIMPKKFLSVVKVKDKLLILGVSENNINLLKEIDAKESDLIAETNPNLNQGFADLFKKYLNK